MSDTVRNVPKHILDRYASEKSRLKLIRGHWATPCAWRENDGPWALGEAWTPDSKRFAKRDVARARRRASKAEVRQEARAA